MSLHSSVLNRLKIRTRRRGGLSSSLAVFCLFWCTGVLAAVEEPLAASAGEGALLLQVQGMTCAGCASTVRSALEALPGVGSVLVSSDQGLACVKADGPLEPSQLGSALEAVGYPLATVDKVERCPDGLLSSLPEPWDHRGEGRDVRTISRGEEVELKTHLVADKYTVIDFGAAWCGPCHEAAERLDGYLSTHDDVAIRAVNLGGQDPTTSYQQPVVAQHLAYVKGVPWFLVHAPGGKLIYKGMDVERVLSVIDRHRKKARGP